MYIRKSLNKVINKKEDEKITNMIMGKQVLPGYINNTEKRYFTELLLIINTTNFENLFFWIKYHLKVIKFEHIIIVYNNTFDKYTELKKNINSPLVDIYHFQDALCQADIYNFFVRISNSQWILPIDNDEYLYISDKYNNNINELLRNNSGYYKYSFNWLSCISKKLMKTADLSVPYYKYYNYCLPLDHSECNTFKTIINTSIHHTYFMHNETLYPVNDIIKIYDFYTTGYNSMGTVHNPISHDGKKYQHSYNISDNTIVPGRLIRKPLKNLDSIDGAIFHFKYRSETEWTDKCSKVKFKDIIGTDLCSTLYNNAKYHEIYSVNSDNLINMSEYFRIFENVI